MGAPQTLLSKSLKLLSLHWIVCQMSVIDILELFVQCNCLGCEIQYKSEEFIAQAKNDESFVTVIEI